MTDAPHLSPSDAAERWLNKRSVSLSDQTLRGYGYRLKVFTDWAEAQGIDSMQDLTPWLVDEFDAKRKGDDLAPISLRNHQQTVRDWLEWASDVGIAPDGVAAAIEVPDVDRSDHVSDVTLDQDAAKALIGQFRDGSDRASKHHVTLELLWFIGCRMGGLRALDLGDVDRDAGVFEFRHRPETGTPLKKAEQGERDVGVTEGTMAIVGEWIDHHRPDVRDDHGRSPLLVTPFGRVVTSTLRDWCYFATVPCRHQSCPHGEECPSCEWYASTGARECPSSRSPHQVRSGSITWQRNRGMDAEVVGRRVNASVRVINQHYDLPTKREEFEQRGRPHVSKLSFDTEDEA
ncbi:integrase [Halobacteriales archaeon QS_6_71_20]|nr:MAG: integrase [Halobacteriales archaeon QS_6_71_20]